MIKEFLNDFMLLFNVVGEGIYGFDLLGNVVFVNFVVECMIGWKVEELFGKKIY